MACIRDAFSAFTTLTFANCPPCSGVDAHSSLHCHAQDEVQDVPPMLLHSLGEEGI